MENPAGDSGTEEEKATGSCVIEQFGTLALRYLFASHNAGAEGERGSIEAPLDA